MLCPSSNHAAPRVYIKGTHEIPALQGPRSTHPTAQAASCACSTSSSPRRPVIVRHVEPLQSEPFVCPRGQIATAWTGHSRLRGQAVKRVSAPRRSATRRTHHWFRRVKRRCASGRSPPRCSFSSSSPHSPVQACPCRLLFWPISSDFLVDLAHLGGDLSIW